MAASRYVQKFTRKPKSQVKDEFFISTDDVIQVTQFKDKIENMHQIQISFENKTEEGQWLILQGEPVDRRNAKNYITAMCNPTEKRQVQFPTSSCTELTDPSTLEYIEKTTNAFIRPLKKIAQFEITGTDLAVTLALSQIEELAGSAVVGADCDQFDDETDGQDEGVITISPNTHNASSRLSSVLERALSANSDGICSFDDYRKTTPAVQRVLVNCLQDDDQDDIDDDLLFADGKKDTSLKGSKIMMFYEGDTQETSKATDVDKEQTEQTSPGATAFADKMTELNINPPVTPLLTKQQEYLRSFGTSVGFQEAEVTKALQFVDEKTRPSDFLDLLNSLQEADVSHENDSGDDVVILETETVDLVTDERTVVDETLKVKDDGKVSDQNKKINAGRPPEEQYQSSLPDGYKERLLRDFFTEDEHCSVDELKKRNAERQKLLRQNFESQQGTPTKQPNAQGQTGKKQNKGKNKRKKNKQQQQSIEIKTDRTDLHDKQFRLDSGENDNKTYSNDDEQTCVLRVWSKDQGQTEPGGGKSTDEPFQTTPKRKNCKGRNNQSQWPQLASGNNNQRQNSPNRAFGAQSGTQWSGPVGRGNFRKPTQVVTPVNAPLGGYNKMAPQGQSRTVGAELRYIIIDGSNVAMTHGNGKHFSCKGIKLCVDYFRQRGHDKITVFVPLWRQYQPSETNMILDQNILSELKEEDVLVFTPSRRIGRKLVVAYDDRFVLELAEAEDGIIVSNDQYRDLMTEKAGWRKLIEERLLMYSFVRDRFMPPNDPLGRDGPCLDDFLTVFKQQVPGIPRQKQGYNYHQQQQHYQQQQQNYQQQYPQPSGHGHFPQGQGQLPQGQGHLPQGQGYYQQGQGNFQQGQGHFPHGKGNFAKAVNQNVHNSENNQPYQKQGSSAKNKTPVQKQLDAHQFDEADSSTQGTKQVKGQWKNTQKGQQGSFRGKVQGIPRTDEETEDLFKELRTIFPDDDQEEKVRNVLANHDRERDLTKLTNYLMSVLF
ncbi:NEDD4-binding protein 1-like [Mercenaria mercenaria]|uniref:NEDD4-binding protein 1-like n=1 Tax=Mercenaria mercenaria TaxID=6596 RepID=UPI00234E6904|nr:NEDD4-binding protein 1-like [Mercenaria mercenaria]